MNPLVVSPAGRVYGQLRDSADTRDKILRLTGTTVQPIAADEGALLGAVRDQGQEGSCVGHGWQGFAAWLFRKFGPYTTAVPEFSPQDIYYLVRQLEGTLPNDAGGMVRTGAKVLNKFGVCPEVDDAYGPATLNTPPSPQAVADAIKYKGGAYHTLPTLGDMKGCLASGYCFVDGIDVFNSFESDAVASSGEVPMPASTEQSLGGHCTLTFGYDDKHQNLDGSQGALHKRNSWGSTWGQGGDFWLPYNYVNQYLNDAWVLYLGPAWH